MLTETSSSPLLHASKAVELFRELLIEEPEDEDALENLWGARRVLEELLENGRVTFWTMLMDKDVKQKGKQAGESGTMWAAWANSSWIAELAQVKKETLPKKVRRSARISALESARAAAVASGSGGLWVASMKRSTGECHDSVENGEC
jgi:hypothetical protein